MNVELIFDSDCPNVRVTRIALKEALVQAGLPAKWTAAGTPQRLGGFGSPSVLIDGVDVAGEPPAGTACCRIYRASDGRMLGALPKEVISRALREARGDGLG